MSGTANGDVCGRGEAGESSPRLGRRKKAVFAAVVFVGIPLLAEAAVRVRDAIRFGSSSPSEQLYATDPELGKVLRPGASLAGATTQVGVNSLGFRGPEIAVPKVAETFRIVCLGGSTTFGTYSSRDETTWPARLQAKLQHRYPQIRIEVINAGVPGYRLATSRINLRQRVLRLEPDLAIVYHVCNDINYQQTKAYGNQSQVARQPLIGTGWLSRHSLLFEKLTKNIQIMRTPAVETQRRDRLPEQAARNFRSDLEVLLADCRNHQLPVLLCTMATQFRADQSAAVRRKAAGTALYYNKYLSIDGLIQAYAAFNAEVQAVAAEHGLVCADVFEAVPGDRQHFGDSVHFTDAGGQRVADCIASALIEAGLIPD